MRETMRDRGAFWMPASDWSVKLEGEGFSAQRIFGLGQTLVSGDLDKAMAALAPGSGQVRLWQIVSGDKYAVRIARDRMLLVTPSPLAIKPCWHDGFVATPCDDAFSVLEISGEVLDQIVAEATSADLLAGSLSAALSFAGVTVFLYRTAPQAARLHIESPLADYLWAWLKGRR